MTKPARVAAIKRNCNSRVIIFASLHIDAGQQCRDTNQQFEANYLPLRRMRLKQFIQWRKHDDQRPRLAKHLPYHFKRAFLFCQDYLSAGRKAFISWFVVASVFWLIQCCGAVPKTGISRNDVLLR